MKRSRAELSSPTTTSTKSPKRSKDNSSQKASQIQRASRVTSSPKSETSHENDNQVLQKKVADQAVKLSEGAEDLQIIFSDEIDLGFGWWPNDINGVCEELLLGWFPFEDRDFFFTENCNVKNAGNWDEFHDIWHLQHIHEVPTSSNT